MSRVQRSWDDIKRRAGKSVKKKASRHVVPAKNIEDYIFIIHGHKVILDSDLAELYSVSTKRFNEQVKRNRSRFPEDFMFQLTKDEAQEWLQSSDLRSQIATSSFHGGRRYLPYAFTEHGALMAANVLNSSKAPALVLNSFNLRANVTLMSLGIGELCRLY